MQETSIAEQGAIGEEMMDIPDSLHYSDAVLCRASGRQEPEGVVAGDERTAAGVLAQVSAYIPRLRERAAETEATKRVPSEAIADLDRMGVFKMGMPVEYGGLALTPSQQHAIVAEIARGCGSTGWVVWVTVTGQQWMALFDRKFQDELFGPEWAGPRTSGALAANGPGIARRVSGGFMLKGKWPWASGCDHAAFFHLGARCGEGEDACIYLLNVPRNQAVILDDWKVMGMRGTGSKTLLIEDEIFVPEYRTRALLDIFHTNRLEPAHSGLLYQVNLVLLTASVMSAVGIGLARAAIELFQAKIHTRGISNSKYGKQSEAPVTHLQLGELYCKLLAAETVARHNLEQVEKLSQEDAPIGELEMARVKLETAHVLKTTSEIGALTLRAAGASSIGEGNPFQRIFRDASVATLHAHTMIETCLEDYGRAVAAATAPQR